MQSKAVSNQEEFLELVTPQTLSCLWVSEEPLFKRESPFWWFDYLMDGNLEAQLKNLPQNPKSFFTAEHFNETFYLLQIEKSFPDLNKSFQEVFQLIKPTEHKKRVLCLAKNPQHFNAPILKQRKDFEFELVLY